MALTLVDLSGNGPSGHSPKVPIEIIAGTFTGTGRSSSFVSHNNFNISLSGTWAGIVSLERSFDDGTTWIVVETFTANTERQVFEPEEGVHYSWNCSTFTSGTIVFRLSNSGS